MPRAPKRCGAPGCDERVTGKPYCPTHQRQHQTRANTTARGYGTAHQQARRAALAAYRPGQPCTRCGQPLQPHDRVDLDHTDNRDGYLGLAHRRCNAQAGAARKARHPPPGGSASA